MNLIANRFEVTQTLGTGAEGTAYLARDRADANRRVVVKVARTDRADGAAHVRRIADFRHPNLAGLIHTGRDAQNAPFAVYTFAPGTPLIEAAGDRTRWIPRIAHALRGLAFLHARGLVHGDLSPENLRVADDDVVRLIDFGLVRRVGADAATGGTPPYIAPEARDGELAAAASDVFALGAVVYHALAGHPPFHVTEGGVIDYDALEPLTGAGIDDALAAWVHALLAPIEERPADARAALVALQAVDPSLELETAETKRAYVRSTPLIARDAELAAIVALFDRLGDAAGNADADDDPPVGLLFGAPGSGKTKLLDAAAHRAPSTAQVVRTAGYAELAPPYALVRDLLVQIDRLDPDEPPLAAMLIEPGSAEPGDALRRHERVTRALVRRASRRRLVLLIDDVHRADTASIDYLAHLTRAIALASPRPAITIVAASTTDAADRIGPIASELQRHHGRLISLSPLDAADTARLIRTTLADNDLDDEAAAWAHRRTRGNPLFIVELLDAIADRFVAPPDELGVRLVLDEETRAAIPPTLAGLLSRRIHDLDDEHRRVLTAASVFLEPTPTPVIARTADLPLARVQSALLALRRDRLVMRDAASNRHGVSDRATRTVATRDLAEDDRAALHARAGDALLDARRPGDLPEIATHFLVADPAGRGRAFAEEAADWSASIAALPRAIDLYAAAFDATPDDARADRTRLANRLSDVYLTTGRPKDAVALLDRTHDDDDTRLRRLGDAHAALGELGEAARCLRAARRRLANDADVDRLGLILRRARIANDRGRPTAALRLSRFMLGWRGPLDVENPAWRAALSDIHARLADVRFNRGEFADASRHAERALTHAGDDPLTSATLLNLMGNIGLRMAALDDARARYERALEIREELGDLRGMASTLNNLAMLAGRSGQLGEAAHSFRRAIELQARIGDRRGQALSLNNLARLYCVEAKFDRAIDAFQQSLEFAQALGDAQTEAMIHANLGAIAAIRGEIGSSLDHRLTSVRLRRALRTPGRMDDTLLGLADVLFEVGDAERAARFYRRVRRRATDAHRPIPATRATIGLARVDATQGRGAHAIETLTALGSADNPPTGGVEVERLLALARAQIDADRLDAARATLVQCRTRVDEQPNDFESADRCALLAAEIDLATDAPAETTTTAVRAVLTRAEGLGARLLAIDATTLLGRLADHADDRTDAVTHFARGADWIERIAATIDSSRLCERFYGSRRTRALEAGAAALRTRTYLRSPDPTVREAGALRALKSDLFDVERTLDFTKTRFDKQNAGLKRVLRIAEQMSSTYETDGLFALMLDSVMELTGAERGFVILRDAEGGNDLHVAAARTHDKHDLPSPEAEISRSVVRRVLDDGEPIVLRDAAGDDILEHSQSVLRLDLRSIMCTPLGSGDEAGGVLYVENRSQSDRFHDDDLELLEIFAHQAAVALANAKLFHDLNRSLDDLREAQDRLIRQEKLRVMGEVASGVLHNLKNLLTPLLGTAQLMLTDDRNRHATDDIKTVERLTLECSAVIRRFSNFAQGRSELGDVSAVDLRALIDEVVMLVRPRWQDESRRSKLERAVDNRIAAGTFVRGDAAQLREVFVNLIYNAADAMPDGGDIVVAATRTGTEVHTSVIDTGVGMSEEVRRRIFDPFFTTKGREGMGVGMSVTELIIQQHGGRIDVDSVEGRGTTMTIVLPSVEPTSTRGDAKPSAPSVLLVDDDPTIRAVLARALEQEGFAVTQAESAEAAQEALEAERLPGVVVTDLQMPGKSGLELADAVKRRLDAIPVILVTGHASTLAARPRTIDALLEKPVAIGDLVEAVRAAAASSTTGT